MTYYINIFDNKINGAGTCPTDNSIEVTKSVYDDYIAEPLKYIYSDGEIVLNPDYEKEMRIKEIDRLLNVADETYETVLKTPIQYVNGYAYKPEYISSYALLIAANNFPLTIWDCSELNGVQMTRDELTALSIFLKNTAEPAFQFRKTTRRTLLEERATLCS